jgi:hypothetical protein
MKLGIGVSLTSGSSLAFLAAVLNLLDDAVFFIDAGMS